MTGRSASDDRRRGDISRPRFRSSVWSGSWGLADQALISLTNFLTMVLVARSLRPGDFGAFVLVYTALLFAGNLQASLITRPHNVLAAGLEGEAYRSYSGTAAASQLALAAAAALLALSAAATAFATGAGPGPLLIALAAAIFAWQLQEFVRQAQYTRGRSDRAFAYDVISYGGQALLVVALWQMDALKGTTSLYAVAATSGVSAAWGLWRLRRDFGPLDWAAIRQNWIFGRWLLGEGLGQWLSSQMLPLLTAALVGVSATGVLKAVQNLIAPAHIVMNAFQSFAIPRAARAFARDGKKGMIAFLLPAAALATLPLVIYWLAIGFLANELLGFLYADGYGGNPELVWLMSLAYLVLHIGQAESIGLMALGDTRSIFAGRLVAILLTFTVGVWLIWQLGVAGALIASTASGAALNLALGCYLWRSGERPASDSAATSAMTLAPAGGEP